MVVLNLKMFEISRNNGIFEEICLKIPAKIKFLSPMAKKPHGQKPVVVCEQIRAPSEFGPSCRIPSDLLCRLLDRTAYFIAAHKIYMYHDHHREYYRDYPKTI